MKSIQIKFFSILCCSLLFSMTTLFSQEKVEKYVVNKGETVVQIAQKFKVTPYEIYKLNPDAQNGLKPNSVLLIPKGGTKNTSATPKTKVSAPKTHSVMAKETLFGIEKLYNVTDEALKKANPALEKDGLQIGQILTIPALNGVKTSVPSKNTVVYHTVLSKETKYSIAKQYDISVEELERKNPEIVANLPVGFQLVIKGNKPKTVENKSVSEPNTTIKKPIEVKVAKEITFIEYVVKSKETFYSLSKKFGITQQQLIALNPDLAHGVQEGMLLKIPSKSNQMEALSDKKKVVLTSKNSAEKKTLVLLMPFNIGKSSSDTISSMTKRLNSDKFLNMTLDFYSGALMAIDSAKQIGVSMDVKIFDSNEIKSTSDVVSLCNTHNLAEADVVIGPFYQSNVEKLASLLVQNNVPVVSPLSKDLGNPLPNLYQSIVQTSLLKTAMFDFMKSKEGNVITVIDKKRESSRKYILENQKETKIAPLTATGGLDIEGFKRLFVKGRINYVVLETANTGMIKYTMSTMLSLKNSYQVQLVILEPNETLDTDEISFENLTQLNLMYPSATRENNSPEAQSFIQSYRLKNKVNPSSFAIRGFDITFDAILRLSQDKTYQETAETMITEQIENKFEYSKKEEGGYFNKGLYILYYDTDLTIKEAK
jgi:LysM repeat protein